MSGLQIVEKYNIFEKSIIGPKTGNPFVDVNFSVRFINGHVTKEIEGFYDGDGVYIVRFMPEFEGTWEYKTISNVKELNKISGEFKCISVIGFDNMPASSMFEPELSTINVPKKYMGEVAVERLISLLNNPGQPPIKTEINTSLIKRNSVKEVNKK